MAAGQKRNTLVVPQAQKAMEQFKYETAAEVGLNWTGGYGGDIPAKQWGHVGGQMVKKMIQAYEQQVAGQTTQPSPLQ
ncbi:MAG: alpha/beta-type small acid-soluble spore protein [Thermoanaerobacteraceae bacterium]|nr:alpha/beta-type small acid-soluble spore protein [Thermoanaerobacteraceae bacterium]